MDKEQAQRMDNTMVVKGGVIPETVSDRISEELTKRYGTPNVSSTSGAVLSRVMYPIARFGLTNGNSRFYDKEIYTENVLKDEKVLDMLRMRNMFMQEEHPPEGGDEDKSMTARIAGIVCDIVVPGFNDQGVYQELKLDPDCAYAIVDVLNTPMGQIVDTLIQAGAGFGVSTRASGTTESVEKDGQMLERVKVEDYVFETIDFTATPSTPKVLPVLVEKQIVKKIREALDKKAISNKLAMELLGTCFTNEAKSLRESLGKPNIKEGTSMDRDYIARLRVEGEESPITVSFKAATMEKAEGLIDKVKEVLEADFGEDIEAEIEPIVAETDKVDIDGEGNIEPKADVEDSIDDAIFADKDVGMEDRILEYMKHIDPSLDINESINKITVSKLNESAKGKGFLSRVKKALDESVKRIAILESEKEKALELLEEGYKGENKYYELDLNHDTEESAVSMLTKAGFKKEPDGTYKSGDGREYAEIKTSGNTDNRNGVRVVFFDYKTSKVMSEAFEKDLEEAKEENKRLAADLDEAMKKVSVKNKKALEEAVKVAVRETKKAYSAKLTDKINECEKLKTEHEGVKSEYAKLKENVDKRVELARNIERRLFECGLKLPEDSVTLLRESETLEQLDSRLVLVKRKLREGLHFNSDRKSIRITESSVEKGSNGEGSVEPESFRRASMLINGIV